MLTLAVETNFLTSQTCFNSAQPFQALSWMYPKELLCLPSIHSRTVYVQQGHWKWVLSLQALVCSKKIWRFSWREKKNNNKKNRLFTFLSKFPRFKKIIKTYVSFWDSCHQNYEALFSSMSGYRKVIKLVVNWDNCVFWYYRCYVFCGA